MLVVRLARRRRRPSCSSSSSPPRIPRTSQLEAVTRKPPPKDRPARAMLRLQKVADRPQKWGDHRSRLKSLLPQASVLRTITCVPAPLTPNEPAGSRNEKTSIQRSARSCDGTPSESGLLASEVRRPLIKAQKFTAAGLGTIYRRPLITLIWFVSNFFREVLVDSLGVASATTRHWTSKFIFSRRS